MYQISTVIRNISIFAVISLTTGCASKWVKRPEADLVKKVAIVSVYMDNRITSDYGEEVSGEGGSFLRNLLGKDKKDQSEQLKKKNAPRKEIVTRAYKQFERAINKVPGWRVVSYERVVRNKQYHAMFESKTGTGSGFLDKLMKVTTRVGTSQYVTPNKLHVLPFDERLNAEQKEAYSKLAKALNVDAIATIHLKLGYDDGWISLASMTKASPVAAAEFLMVNRNGEIAAITPRITKDSFMEADGSVWVSNRKLKLDKKAIGMYDQAINMVADSFSQQFTAELQEAAATR